MSAEDKFEDFDNFFLELLPQKIIFDLNLDITVNNHNPNLLITFNDTIILNKEFNEGVHKFSFELVPESTNCLQLTVTKTDNDTLVKNGKIIKDTSIKLINFNINDYYLLDDYHFFKNYFHYYDNKTKNKEETKDTFWASKTLELNFDSPFEQWYNNKTTKNINVKNTELEATDIGYKDRLNDELISLAKTLI